MTNSTSVWLQKIL